MEAVKAWIVLKEGQTASPEELQKFCRERLTGYKVPRYIEFRKDLPKTFVGKVLRRLLQDEEISKQDK
jgi:long-chain acyl-CoA synthetase